ncbi:MAG: hypothetical protein ACRC7R_10405 [Sarcina sp.]
MSLLSLQNIARGRKYEQGKLGANNMLGINNKLTGKCVSNYAATARVVDIPVVEEVPAHRVDLRVVESICEDLNIMACLLPGYNIKARLAYAYGVCIEAIEMAIEDGELTVVETANGYRAELNR